MRVFKDFEELKAAVGTEIGVGDWIEITQDRINAFADATGDEQWIHVDEARPRITGQDYDRAWTADALADPDVHAVDDRIERLEKYIELWRQPDSLSLSGPRRLTSARARQRLAGGGCAARCPARHIQDHH